MQPSVVMRVLFSHALLSFLRLSATVIGAGGDLHRASYSSSFSSDHVISSIVDDDGHEEIHPGAPIRMLGPPSGGFVSDWNRDWFQTGGGSFGGRPNQGKCINIPDNMTLCRGIGYNQMRLPNLLEHDSVKEATQQAASWVPLMNVRCHPDTQVFLCSLFAPVCLDRPIWPCKTLCEAVKTGCESRMRKYGFPWPEMLRCEQFPSDNDLCIGMRQENQSDESSCPACVQPETFEIIVDNFCSADYAMKIRLEQVVVSGSDLKLVAAKKKKAFKRGSLLSKELRDAIFYVENGAQCKCTITNELKSNQKVSGSYLIMGNRRNNRLALSFIEKIDRKSVDMTKAMDAIRKGKICKSGIQMITPDEMKKVNGKEKEGKITDKNSDGKKGKAIKDNKQEDGKKNREGKKDEGRKVEGKKKEGNKAEGNSRGMRKEETTKGIQKMDRKKTENGKRSVENRRVNSEKGKHQQKEPV